MPIQEIETTTLDEFWEKISPIGNFIDPMKQPIFRGQGDSSWLLTPSVLRKEINSKYRNQDGYMTQIDQIVFLSICFW